MSLTWLETWRVEAGRVVHVVRALAERVLAAGKQISKIEA